MISLRPMQHERVRSYLRTFVDWYTESLDEHGLLSKGSSGQDYVAEYLANAIGPDGLPVSSTVFDVETEDAQKQVGIVWAGGANFGFGPLFYIHDLRIFPPFRRQGHAAAVLSLLSESVAEAGSLRGIALSVLASNVAARDLYDRSGFKPVSTVMFKSVSPTP